MIKLTTSRTRSHAIVCTSFIVLAISAMLSGCASETLKRALIKPDKPWQPKSEETTTSTSTTGSSGITVEFSVPALPEASILPPVPDISSKRSYNLPELIDIAQLENPETRIAWNQARQAALELLPGDHRIDTELNGIAPVLALEWLIFDFGQRKALVEGAKHLSFAANVLLMALTKRSFMTLLMPLTTMLVPTFK